MDKVDFASENQKLLTMHWTIRLMD